MVLEHAPHWAAHILENEKGGLHHQQRQANERNAQWAEAAKRGPLPLQRQEDEVLEEVGPEGQQKTELQRMREHDARTRRGNAEYQRHQRRPTSGAEDNGQSHRRSAGHVNPALIILQLGFQLRRRSSDAPGALEVLLEQRLRLH